MKNLLIKAFALLLLTCAIFSFSSCGFTLDSGKPSAGGDAYTTEQNDSQTPSFGHTEEQSQSNAESEVPSEDATLLPSEADTADESAALPPPTEVSTVAPTDTPTETATNEPTVALTEGFTQVPTVAPTEELTQEPTDAPTESVTVAPTEIPTEAPTDAPTDAPSVGTEAATLSPELEEIAEINSPSKLLSPTTSLLITVDRYDAEELLEKYSYIYRLDAEETLTFDVSQTDKQGQFLSLCNYIDGALYAWENDGTLTLGLLPKKSEAALFIFAVDLRTQTPKGEAVSDGETLLLETSYLQDGIAFECVYRFDPESKRLLSGERTAFSDGSFLYREELTYRYADDTTSFVADTSAYTAITAPADGQTLAIELVEVDGEGIKSAKRNYTFAKNTEVVLVSNGYALYKNSMCTADVADVKAYLTDEAITSTIYLAPKRSDISFDYTLTDADFEEFKTLLAELEALALAGDDLETLVILYEKVTEKYLYLASQADAGYLLYCRDQHSAETQEVYSYSSKVQSDALVLYHGFLENLYNSSSPAKEFIFDGWTEEELQERFGRETHEQEIYDLQHQNDQLTVTFYDLIGDGTPPWDEAAVADLYVQLVENNQELARLHGYDNYYNYAAKEIYGRSYTAEEREIFREYVATYIVPLLVHAYDRFYELSSDLTFKQYLAYSDLLESPYNDRSGTYLQGYIDSYGGELSGHMNALFEKNSVIFAENEGSYAGAFVSYSQLYEEPYAYFGVGYQDILSVVHELGHYASLYTYSLEEMSYDLAETHSQGNEWMFLAYLEDQLDPAVAELMVTYRLYSGLLNIVYSAMVDEFEDIVYHAETPLAATELEAIVATLAEKYGGAEFLKSMSSYTPYQYVQYVSFSAPVYYLNYATSEIVSISLYLEAHESYENAQTLYCALQEDADIELGFIDNIEAMGFLSPFEKTLYEELCVLFGVTVSVSSDVQENAA